MNQCECMLRVGVLGINHKTADLELREAVARACDSLMGEAGLFFSHRVVVLSTCNRTEIYFSAPVLAEVHCDLLRYLRCFLSSSFEHRLYSYFGVDCLTHLCRVTAGLDSAILGESEIQGQVKTAYARSARRELPSPLHFLFQKGLKVGKEARSRIISNRTTLSGILWELAKPQEFSRILFVGNSQVNRGVMRFFQQKGLTKIDLCSREQGTHGREVLDHWDEYDLIISATKASDYLLHLKEINPKPRIIFDLSVPRNVDPLLGTLPGVTLYNIEQIHQLIEGKRRAQQKDVEECEQNIQENVQRLCSSYRKRLEFSMAWTTRKRDHIANVLHSCHEEN